jgi:hypothetical protein
MNSFSGITRLVSAGIILAAFPVIAVAAAHTGAPDTTQTVARTSTAASCPRGWGSLPESSRPVIAGELTGVRSGRHACFDRLVLDLNGRPSGYRVGYVREVATDGAGTPVPLRGGARLEVVLITSAYDENGRPTYRPANRRELVNTSGYQTFRQVAYAGSYEGQTTIGVGVRARLPFRVFTLSNPGRVVIDVAHRW